MMNTNGIEVKKDTFNSLDQKGRDGVIYDYLEVIYKKVIALERAKKADHKKAMWIGGLAGFFGGVTTVLSCFAGKMISALF